MKKLAPGHSEVHAGRLSRKGVKRSLIRVQVLTHQPTSQLHGLALLPIISECRFHSIWEHKKEGHNNQTPSHRELWPWWLSTSRGIKGNGRLSVSALTLGGLGRVSPEPPLRWAHCWSLILWNRLTARIWSQPTPVSFKAAKNWMKCIKTYKHLTHCG